jgi:hypothetical protein
MHFMMQFGEPRHTMQQFPRIQANIFYFVHLFRFGSVLITKTFCSHKIFSEKLSIATTTTTKRKQNENYDNGVRKLGL